MGVASEDTYIAHVDARNEANAQLIATAPDMYEALKLYQKHQRGTIGHYCGECALALKQALAKAEGK